MVIVGKATQNPDNPYPDNVEWFLPQFRDVLQREKRFVDAWDFNPDEEAIAALRRNLPYRQGLDETWINYVGDPYYSPLKMRIVDFYHDRRPAHCPEEWKRYCIPDLWCIDTFANGKPIHLWFLVDQIEPVEPPADVRLFKPFFGHKYQMYGRNFFGFFRQ